MILIIVIITITKASDDKASDKGEHPDDDEPVLIIIIDNFSLIFRMITTINILVNKVGEEESDIFYQPTGTNQIFPVTVKASDTIDTVVFKIHKLVEQHFEGYDSDLIELKFKEFLIIIF